MNESLFSPQKSFLDFSRERHGRNYVYFQRRTPRIVERYGEDVVVITPAMRKAPERDYRAAWGKEAWPGDDAPWKALCALRAVKERNPWPEVPPTVLGMVDQAIEALTTI